MDEERRICDVEEVPADGSFLFTVRDDDEEREAILLATDASENGDGSGDASEEDGDPPDVAGWLNYCQHFTHIKLDKGSGATMRDGEVVCTNHGAYFEADSGLCTFGPCEGAYLTEVTVAVEDGGVYLTDPDFEFVEAGPVDDDPLDLTSTSNVEF